MESNITMLIGGHFKLERDRRFTNNKNVNAPTANKLQFQGIPIFQKHYSSILQGKTSSSQQFNLGNGKSINGCD
jgi:hypothetical protein